MARWTTLWLAAVFTFTAGLSACENEPKDDIEDAAEEIEDTAEEAGEEAEDAAEDAADDIEETAEEATDDDDGAPR